MIWIANNLNESSPSFAHIQRHVKNAELFVRGITVSSYQGDPNLIIPDELNIDTGRRWDGDRVRDF